MKSKKHYSVLLMCGLALVASPLLFAKEHAENKFKSMDIDGDGRISRVEYKAGAAKLFGQLDTNRDDSVTAEEMDAGHKMKDKDHKVAGSSKPGDKDKSSAEKIQLLDTNNDGKLSKTEHEAGASSMFDKMDGDTDGFLTEDEMKAGHEILKKGK